MIALLKRGLSNRKLYPLMSTMRSRLIFYEQAIDISLIASLTGLSVEEAQQLQQPLGDKA